MHCRDCDYPLWNLKTRACPECGAPFVPSAYDFVPSSVRFCCPACDQPYYGTGPKGHLVPDAFECVTCGTPQTMDEMVLRPVEGIEGKHATVDVMPWLRSSRDRRLRGWLHTVGRSMVNPARLIRGTPADSSVGRAWLYAAVTITFILLVGAGVPFFLMGLIVAISGGNSPDAMIMFGVGGAVVLGGVAATLGVIALWGLVTHAILRLSGGAPHSIGRTYHALCYSVGANITTAVPCVGFYPFIFVGLSWWLVSAVLMLAAGQRVHGGRATLAALAFPALLVTVVTAGGVFALTRATTTTFRGGMGAPQTVAATAMTIQRENECGLVVSAILQHAEEDDGTGPVHAIALFGEEYVSEWDFLGVETLTYLDDVPVGGTSLAALAALAPARRERLIDTIIDNQPADVAAHRLGDFVFIHHGVDITAAGQETWLVIMSPDPDHNLDRGLGGFLVVGGADGLVRSIAVADFDRSFAEQNAMRRTMGWPEVPPPWEVTHDGPAQRWAGARAVSPPDHAP